MTLTIKLDEATESRLRAKAQAEGTPVEALAAKLIATSTEPAAASESLLDDDYHAECELDPSLETTLDEVRTALSKIPGSLTSEFLAERDER
jgi:intein-encoded DNA endonuclease-like protein